MLATRHGIILLTVSMGAAFIVSGLPSPFQRFGVGAACLLQAYVYAQLTKPRRPL